MMDRILAAIEALALALWVGGLASFAFVFAPLAFHAMPDVAVFGHLTAQILTELGALGALCGTIAIAIELSRLRGPAPLRGGAGLRLALLAVMLAGTAVETLSVVPKMTAAISTVGGERGGRPGDARSEDRARFDAAHHASSVLYGIVLLCGLATIGHGAFTGRRKDSPVARGTLVGPGVSRV